MVQRCAPAFSLARMVQTVKLRGGPAFARAGVPISTCCAQTEDVPYSPAAIERFYGSTFPLFVSLRFDGLDGYGWVFPKRDYICVGIGGRVAAGSDIREILRTFVDKARDAKLIPKTCKFPSRIMRSIPPALFTR